jgi:Ni/Co efflux regulator RcnB
MLCSGKEDTAMLKRVVLTLAGIAMLAIPTIASARDRDDYVYGRDGRRRDNHEWRERHREHERHEWREHERREREYYGGYNNGYYNSPSYRNGYYDAYGNWHPYGW